MAPVHDQSGMIERRRFIWTVGSGALAVGVFGLAACGDPEGEPGSTLRVTSTAGAGGSTGSAGATTTGATDAAAEPLTWTRASFVFVSAYVLTRGGRAAIVDTGVDAGQAAIEEALAEAGLGWAEVDHIVLTHHHPDHVGGLGAAAELAAAATLYAGEADIGSIDAPRELMAVGDGSEVMGLTVIDTPGHTAGSISVLDPDTGVLVVGDALSGGDDGATVSGSNPEFTADGTQARESVLKLAGYSFETILFGHGEPVLTGGADLLADYAASLSTRY
jgi:glyoxylase-like metal-dependent hydrolase (beta-lactamase superfamily II)